LGCWSLLTVLTEGTAPVVRLQHREAFATARVDRILVTATDAAVSVFCDLEAWSTHSMLLRCTMQMLVAKDFKGTKKKLTLFDIGNTGRYLYCDSKKQNRYIF